MMEINYLKAFKREMLDYKVGKVERVEKISNHVDWNSNFFNYDNEYKVCNKCLKKKNKKFMKFAFGRYYCFDCWIKYQDTTC